MILLIKLPVNRDFAGEISLEDGNGKVLLGPFPVAGRSAGGLAAAHGNVRRDPRLKFGDTPLGSYRLAGFLKTGRDTGLPAPEFGRHGVLVLNPTGGDAAMAEANGRFHFVLGGGNPAPDGRLRPTAGGLRVANAHMEVLAAWLRERRDVRCVISAGEALLGGSTISDVEPAGLADPLTLPKAQRRTQQVADSRSMHLTRALLVAASFAAVHEANAAPSADLTIRRDTEQSVSSSVQLPVETVAQVQPRFVRIDYITNNNSPTNFIDNTPVQNNNFISTEDAALLGVGALATGVVASQLYNVWTANDTKRLAGPQAGGHFVADPVRDRAISSLQSAAKRPGAPARLSRFVSGADAAMPRRGRSFAISALQGQMQSVRKAQGNSPLFSSTEAAVNDYSSGKIGIGDFVKKIGPDAAKALLAQNEVPFTDQLVDISPTVLQQKYGPAISQAIDGGFDLYAQEQGSK